jgi:hypothetical protein
VNKASVFPTRKREEESERQGGGAHKDVVLEVCCVHIHEEREARVGSEVNDDDNDHGNTAESNSLQSQRGERGTKKAVHDEEEQG